MVEMKSYGCMIWNQKFFFNLKKVFDDIRKGQINNGKMKTPTILKSNHVMSRKV